VHHRADAAAVRAERGLERAPVGRGAARVRRDRRGVRRRILAGGGATFVGDLFGVIAAFLWASTIVLIRATKLARTSATKTLLYQLAVSAAVLVVASFAMGEPGVVRVTPLAVAVMAYQGVLVRVRELPRLVLAAHEVLRGAAVGPDLHVAAVSAWPPA